MISPENNSFSLVLNSWLIMYLFGERPGGSPADFLSRGASSLLVFDTILCDEHALRADEPFVGKWLSSDIFAELKREGILKPINTLDYFDTKFLSHLDETGLKNAAKLVMENELQAMKIGKHENLELPKLLTWLNHYMFLGLNVPNSLLYEWQESHFKFDIPKFPQSQTINTAELNKGITYTRDIFSVIKTMLPEISLLPPPIPGSDAENALHTNIEKEKYSLYRWILGDSQMSQQNYIDFRLGAGFTALDRKVDDSRKAQAWHNFNLLMKVREQTKDIRLGVQRIINDVVTGNRTIDDVKDELILSQQELMTHLPNVNRTKLDVGLATTGLAVALVGSLSGLIPPSIGLALGATDLIMAAKDVWESRKNVQELNDLRSNYPLAFLLRDFRHIQNQENQNLKPKRFRK
ncbi:hypothetical protein KC799_05320 [candidate division KSB1 bacterium]|nr:hypothetical protein [candidate division KSB1 bacterium]